MTEVLLRIPGLREIRVEIEERDENPAQLNLEEATEVLRRARPLVSGDFFLRQSSIEVGGRNYSFQDVLIEPYRREVLHETEPMSYPDHPTRIDWMVNMRTLTREYSASRWRQPFLWSNSELRASARPMSEPEHIEGTHFSRWRIAANIELTDPEASLEVDPETSTGEILSVEPIEEANGHYRVLMEVEAPGLCSFETETRRYAELGLRVFIGSGEHAVRVPIDYTCLLGDHPSFESDPEGQEANLIFSDFAADLGRSPQPQIEILAGQIRQALASRAETASLENVLRALREILILREATYRSDPPAFYAGIGQEFFPNWSRPVRDPSFHDLEMYLSYTLQPDETLRYGGDCEDWATFAVALLSRLGFQAYVQLDAMHAWAEVAQNGEVRRVDLTSESEGFWTCSPLLFPEEPNGTPSWACPFEE